jgi:hypothetical protein
MATTQKLKSKDHGLTIPHPEPSTIEDVMEEMEEIRGTLDEILIELRALRDQK